jgi:hypothetical protein
MPAGVLAGGGSLLAGDEGLRAWGQVASRPANAAGSEARLAPSSVDLSDRPAGRWCSPHTARPLNSWPAQQLAPSPIMD